MGEELESRSLRQGIRKIYRNMEFSDVVFIIKGQQFKAHRLILASRSSLLARLLLDINVEEIIIEKETITANGFGILLRFIYTDEMGTEDKRSIVEAYLAAEFYEQKSLQKECEKKIESWTINTDEVCQLLDAGLTIPKLKNDCINVIRHNANDVLYSPSFLNISFLCLVAVLESQALNDVPILKRIDRIMEWAAKRHTVPVNYELVRREFETNTPPLLGKLGVEKLCLDDLAAVVGKYKGLLTNWEVVKFVEFQTDKNTQLPSWCDPAV